MLGASELNERVTPMTNGNGMKRSHEQQAGSDEDRGVAFHDTERSSSDEETRMGDGRNKAPRIMNFEQPYAALLQSLDSPSTSELWKQDTVNPVSQSFSTSPLRVSNANERRNEIPETEAPLIQREDQTGNGLQPRPHTFTDTQGGTWAFNPPAQENACPPGLLPSHQAGMQQVSHPMTTNSSQQPDPNAAYGYYPYPNGSYPPAPMAGYGYDAPPHPFHNPYALPPGQHVYPTYQQPYMPNPPYLQQQGTAQAPPHHRQNSNDSSQSGNGANSSPEVAAAPAAWSSAGQKPVLMHIARDDDILSDYQIFLRKQIEFFEADEVEVSTATPGRKKPVVLGQVGMRCIHCADVPIQQRASATAYFPSKLKGLYQAAQNIGTTHFRKSCPNIPHDMQEQAKTAFQVNGKRASAGHGGKQYWAESAGTLGVVETENGLRFSTPN